MGEVSTAIHLRNYTNTTTQSTKDRAYIGNQTSDAQRISQGIRQRAVNGRGII